MGFQAIPKMMPSPKGQPRPPVPSPKGGGRAPTPKGGQAQPATPKDMMRQRIAQQQQNMQQQQQSLNGFAPSKPVMTGRATPKSGMIR